MVLAGLGVLFATIPFIIGGATISEKDPSIFQFSFLSHDYACNIGQVDWNNDEYRHCISNPDTNSHVPITYVLRVWYWNPTARCHCTESWEQFGIALAFFCVVLAGLADIVLIFKTI